MRPACNWITIRNPPRLHPCNLPTPPSPRLLKLHHAIWPTSKRRANTSRFPVNIDNANCLSQIARGKAEQLANGLGGWLSSLAHTAHPMQIDWVNRSQVVAKTHVLHYERKGASSCGRRQKIGGRRQSTVSQEEADTPRTERYIENRLIKVSAERTRGFPNRTERKRSVC